MDIQGVVKPLLVSQHYLWSTTMPRGVNRTGAAVGRRYRSGPHRGLWRGVRCFLRAQGTMGLVGETRKRLGLLGALPSRPDGLRGRSLCRSTSAGPGSVQHDTQPQESQDRQLVVKKVRKHGTTPSLGGEMGGLYLMLGPMELSAARRYTTRRTASPKAYINSINSSKMLNGL